MAGVRNFCLILYVLILMLRLKGFADYAPSGPSPSTGRTGPTGSPATRDMAPAAPATPPSGSGRRGLPQPLDNVFEYISDYPGPVIGIPDTTTDYPLTKAVWDVIPAFQQDRIRVYGWFNPGISFSTSMRSNAPIYAPVVPDFPELDEGVLRIAREVDTYQTDHIDWGFHFTSFYGIDYRWTTSQGWLSDQLLKKNQLYGYDPYEAYGLIYFPHVAQGMVIQFGRFPSPPDIESNLAPFNFLFTHSIFFNFDGDTLTGINAQIMLNPNWTIIVGLHGGDDEAPWAPGAHIPSGQFLVRWVSDHNNDSLYGGVNSINDGRFKGFHANQQQLNLTWSHRIGGDPGFVDELEGYYMYVYDSVAGGTCIFGPSFPYAAGGGCGAPLPGLSSILGFTNYTEKKISDSDFLSIRESWINDVRGERSGFATPYWEFTIGVTHHFNDLLEVRPEIRYEFAVKPGITPYDNGTRKSQATFNMDLIQSF